MFFCGFLNFVADLCIKKLFLIEFGKNKAMHTTIIK